MRKLAAVVGLVLLALLNGCSVAHVSENVTTVSSSVVRNGSVHGGNQPVVGATVQLWQVGTTGYGTGATPLGNSVQSLSDGSFSITGKYNCANGNNGPNTLVYITATGGNPGSTGNNNQLLMMTALGQCQNLTPSTFISINEVTTVAAVYALAQFMDATGNIGSYGYSNTGLANAFATVNNLVNTTSGVALATTANGQVPQPEINTIANIMASCVNSVSGDGGTPSTTCSGLFAAATPTGAGSAGSSAPANTLAVARNMALYPWFNAGVSSTLFTTYSGTVVAFAPALNTAPNDWTIALSFAGGGSSVRSVAIDGSGFVWTANYASGAGGLGSISRLNALGVPVTNSPFTLSVVGPYAVAIDTNNDAWVVNHDSSQVVEYAGNGNTLAGPFQFNETDNPVALAIDGNNDLWITNAGQPGTTMGSVTEFNGPSYGSNGHTLSPNGTGYTAGGINNPDAVALDGSGNAWIADLGVSALSEIGPDGSALSPTGGYTGGGLAHPDAVAMDSGGNAWIANAAANTLSKFTGGTGTSYTVNGPGSASAVAVDGSGRVYLLKRTPVLTLFSSAGVQITTATTGSENGYTGGNMNGPSSMAIDASGNVWIGNQSPTTVNGGLQTVTEFVGLATPSITPMSQAVQQGQVGEVPGTPIPVVVQTSFLPYYTPGFSYATQLIAGGGNTNTFTWSINTGTPPAGFALSTNGQITNSTPTANPAATFTVKACDTANAANCAVSGPLTLTPSTTLAAGGAESLLNGHYVIRFNGFNNNMNHGNGVVRGFDEVMNLVFDGNGTITSGEYDFNNPGATNASALSASGNYTLGADHRGIMVLSVNGFSANFAISVANLNGSSIAQDLRTIEFDDTLASGAPRTGTGAGVGKLQTATTVAFNQSFVFGIDGETPCVAVSGNTCPNGVFAPFGYVAAVGQFTANSGGAIVSGEADASANSATYSGLTLSGSFGTPDASGRGTLSLVQGGGTFPLAPADYVYYVVSPTELYIMSKDTHANFTMLSGDMLVQTTAFTPSSALSGNFIAYESSPSDGNGTNFYPDQSGAGLIFLTASGSSLTGYQDSVENGNVKLARSIGANTSAFDTDGRMSIASDGSGPPVFYFANASQGFAMEQPSSDPDNQGDTGLLVIEGQTGGPFTCTQADGTASLGTIHPPVPLGVSNGSVVRTSGSTAVTATLDNSDPSGILTVGDTLSLTCVPDQDGITTSTTGRFIYTQTDGQTVVSYAISPTKQVLVNTTPNQGNPSVIIVQK